MKNLTDFSLPELIIIKNELESMRRHNNLVEGAESLNKEQKEGLLRKRMKTEVIQYRLSVINELILHIFNEETVWL